MIALFYSHSIEDSNPHIIARCENFLDDIKELVKQNQVTKSQLISLREVFQCNCGSVGSFGESRIVEKEEFQALIDSLDVLDDDCQELINDEQTCDTAASCTEASIGEALSAQERIVLRRKQLADALRKGKPITVSQNGNIGNSTADAIAALREQLANGGELMVNSDGTILTSTDSEQANVGFTPVQKAVCGGGDPFKESLPVPAGKLAPSSKYAGGYGMCRVCGTVFNQETNYCPCCGTKTVIEKPLVQLEKVFFSAVASKFIYKGEYSMIDIFMYEEGFRSVVEEAIANAEKYVKETKSGMIRAGKESNIKVVLSSPDLSI